MDEAEYSGIRATLEAKLESMCTPLKIDISTGDVITPKEIEFHYKLMFEDRTISIFAYNLETVLAEKLETIITRGTANTRLRDFYDLYILQQQDTITIDYQKLKMALKATSIRRHSERILERGAAILNQIHTDKGMQNLWKNYQNKYDYAQIYTWEMVINETIRLYDKI